MRKQKSRGFFEARRQEKLSINLGLVVAWSLAEGSLELLLAPGECFKDRHIRLLAGSFLGPQA